MFDQYTLNAIAYACNFALENEKAIKEAGNDTDEAHALFIQHLKRGRDAIEEMQSGEAVVSGWHVDDVLSLDDSLTREEAKEILESADHNHDASIGINWDVLETLIDNFKYDKEQENAISSRV